MSIPSVADFPVSTFPRRLTTEVRRGPGAYTVHTPHGTFLVDNCPADEPRASGLPSGPRWMLTWPGEYSADAEFPTRREARQHIRDILNDVLRAITPEFHAAARRNFHADDSPYLIIGAAEKEAAARNAAADTAPVFTVPANACHTHKVTDGRGRHADTLAVPPCDPNVSTYGTWDEHEGGFVYTEDCAWSCASFAAELLDDDTDGEFRILPVCPEHEEQPAGQCGECG